MSAQAIACDSRPDQVERRLELHRRFLLAGLQAPRLFEAIPDGVSLYLLPDDDPPFTAAEIAAAAGAANRGADVYLRHVRVASLPD